MAEPYVAGAYEKKAPPGDVRKVATRATSATVTTYEYPYMSMLMTIQILALLCNIVREKKTLKYSVCAAFSDCIYQQNLCKKIPIVGRICAFSGVCFGVLLYTGDDNMVMRRLEG